MTNTYCTQSDTITTAIKAANIIKTNIRNKQKEYNTTQVATYARNQLQTQANLYYNIMMTSKGQDFSTYHRLYILFRDYAMRMGGLNNRPTHPDNIVDRLIKDLDNYDEFLFWTGNDLDD